VAGAATEMPGAVLEITGEAWDREIAVTLTGVFNTARATLTDLLRTQGSFVAVASDAGIAGFQDAAAYVAAKHGVVGLVRAMALDYGPRGVRSNAVCPGPTNTPMLVRLGRSRPEELRRYAAYVPLGRVAEPSAVAEAIAHLTSVAACHTNGLAYVVDGGSHAGQFDPIGRGG
jgi:meso-butanediol dehydrogenase / (S,S)-butanediol dehydrogenase / diacetyl reductase